MKLIIAFLRLIRSINLLFIAITQVLFQYCVVVPELRQAGVPVWLHTGLFTLLVVASVFIAAGGYIINDYFDINIDRVNKPQKMVVEKLIRRRSAILWHFALSSAGILISFYVGWKIHNLLLGVANGLCVILLWIYSTSFKKRLLLGNIIISLLTAWVVLVLYFVLIHFYGPVSIGVSELKAASRIFKLAVLYGGFAFIISLVREVVKDIEDMDGDARYGCRTMPLVWGIQASKIFALTWLVVLLVSIVIVQVYVLPFHWWWPALYSLLLIVGPLLLVIRKLWRAASTPDFASLSIWIKLVMFTGILSMIFFKLYA